MQAADITRAALALQLKRSGMTVEAIAGRMGIQPATARRYVELAVAAEEVEARRGAGIEPALLVEYLLLPYEEDAALRAWFTKEVKQWEARRTK